MKLFIIISLLLFRPFTAFSQDNTHPTFAVIGDYGKDNSDEKDVSALIKEHNPDFILTVGDNNYSKGCKKTIDKNIGKYFHEYIYNYKGKYGKGSSTRRFYPTLGNHDWNAKKDCPEDGTLPYFHYFDLPGNERYYDFVKGPIHFFAIDSDNEEPDGNEKGSRQYEWLKEKMESSQSKFKVVYFHHPPYSSGDHGNEEEMQWDFPKLGADVVIAGHDHAYERIERDGIYYIVNGLGGASTYDFEKKVKGSKKRYNKKHGALFAKASDQYIDFTFINIKNDKVDTFKVYPKNSGSGHDDENKNLTVIEKGDTWKYSDHEQVESNWMMPDFNPMSWKEGKAPLGFGDKDLSTTISYGPNEDEKYITAYFIKTFEVNNPDSFGKIKFYLRRNDGAIIYLNGKAVVYSNINEDDHQVKKDVSKKYEKKYYKYKIKSDELIKGKNVIAVEVHQKKKTSSNLVFDLKVKLKP